MDRNEFQANVRTEDLIPLEPIDAKFQAFGWSASIVDGHDFAALREVFQREVIGRPTGSGVPTAIIAKTVRGKGLPSIEARADRWFVNFSHEEIQALLKELHGEELAKLTSETLMVR